MHTVTGRPGAPDWRKLRKERKRGNMKRS